MLSPLRRTLILGIGLVYTQLVMAQCPPGPLGTGQFLNKPSGCATFGLDIEWRLFYNQLDDDAVINIDWGDGTANTTFNVGTTGAQTGINVDMIFPHTYTEANTTGGCEYTMTAWVVSGPGNCYTIQATTVEANIVIWNTDDFGNTGPGLAVDPMEVLVCAGTTATIQLEDVSPWNCTDAALVSPAALNDLNRWVQWEYGVVNTITGNVLVGGVNQAPYPFLGNRFEYSTLPVLAPINPNSLSLEVDIPNTAVANEEFHIRLNNWNQCNPYEDIANVPTGLAPVVQDVILRIIDPPMAIVTATGGPGPYCVGENIQFQYGGVDQPGFTYLWDFGDGNSSTDRDPIHSYNAPGAPYDVTVTVTNGNLNVNCTVQTNPPFQVTVIDAPQPVIAVEDVLNMPAPSEYCVGVAPVDLLFSVDPSSTAPNPGNTVNTWNFYLIDDPGTIDVTIVDTGVDIPRQFTLPGEYLIELVSTDNITTCTNTVQETIVIFDDPQATYAATEVCAGERTNLSAISDAVTAIPKQVQGDQIAFWDWDFSYDGVTFNQELRLASNADFDWYLDGNPVIGEVEPATSVAGDYDVALRVTTQFGQCSDLLFTTVTVKPIPQATFVHDYVLPICPDESINLTNTSVQPTEVLSIGPVDYQLVINDNVGSPTTFVPFLGPDLSINLDNTTGADIIYTINLQATAAAPNSCIQLSNPLVAVVKPAFDSGFDDPLFDPFDPNCSPLSGTFEVDASTQALNVTTYTWTVFDGATTITGFPQIKTTGDPDFHELAYQIENTSQASINYRVVLEADRPGICINDAEQIIRVNPIPNADFTQLDNVDECETKEAIFSADQIGLVDYAWSFSTTPDIVDDQGDQIRARWNRPDQATGDLTVTVTLDPTNGFGCQAATPATFDLLVSAQPDNFVASFDVTPIEQTLPSSTVSITNTTIDDNYSFVWDFGDGQTSNQKNPGSHTYTTSGSYEIALTVGSGFCEEVATQLVEVLPTFPEADFEADEDSGCPPHLVNFTNLTQFAEDDLYVWDFGDGNTSTDINPTHLYFEPGRYTVSLQATNSLDETDTETKQFFIDVLELPIASFDPRPREVFLPASVTMVNFSRGASTYFWDFGDGGTSDEIEPQYEYVDEGDYNVTLVATSEAGCTDSLTISTAVTAVTGGQIRAPNAFTPNPDGPSGGSVTGAGGGLNDVFLPLIEGVTEFKMQIYNRWGNIMFETTSFDVGWDGYFNGKLAPQGVYVYRLEMTFQNNQREVEVGDFTLIR